MFSVGVLGLPLTAFASADARLMIYLLGCSAGVELDPGAMYS
jgi:hypothetical protein